MVGTEMKSYNTFLGTEYRTLLKDPSFISLVGGNVPEVLNPSSDAFYISSYTTGIEFKFERKTERLIAVVVSNSSFYAGDLRLLTNREQVLSILGNPNHHRPEKTIPVLGCIGAMDEYLDSRGVATQVVYETGSFDIAAVHYQMKTHA